jgi:RNA polymerase sigma-70 factor (ECF subfamily)
VIRAREDRWFDRYRRNGDPRLLARVFDRTAPELWKVATHLCRDRHAVEDAVQGTFLVAIEARQAWDASRPLLPWLLGLLVNRVRDLRRRTRSPDAEHLTLSPGEADPAELAQFVELQHGLAATLQRLAEPYRTTVERHLVRGEGAAEIAAAIGVPAGTVRMRLHRGIELLRERLPVGFAGGGAALMLTSESFAAMRRTVLCSGPGGAAVGGAAVAGSGHFLSVWLGVILMQKTTIWLAGALLAGVFAWWMAGPALADPGPRVAVPTTTRPSGTEPLGTVDPVPVLAESAAPAAVRVGAAAAPNEGDLRVLLVRQDDGRPIPGVSLTVKPDLPASPSGVMTLSSLGSRQTGADGVARFRVPIGRCEVSSWTLPHDTKPWQVDVLPGQQTELRIELPIRVRAEVQVVDGLGRPVGGARLVGRTMSDVGEVVDNELGRTGVDGWWRAAFVESHVPVRALHDGYVTSTAAELTVQAPTARLVLGDGPGALLGIVFGRDGRPLPKAQVLLQPHGAGFAGERPLAVVADAGGGFRFDHLPPGPCTVMAVNPIGVSDRRWARAEATVAAGQQVRSDVAFASGASIVVSIRGADGEPVVGRQVHAGFQPEPQLWVHLGALRTTSKTTDERGVAEFEDLPAGDYEVQASLPEGAQRSKVRVHRAEPVHVDWQLGPTSFVAVELVDEAGQPLVGWHVILQPESGQRKEARSDARGMVRFEPARAPAGQLLVRAPESQFVAVQQPAVVGVPSRLVIATAQLASASLRGRAQLANGIEVSEVSIQMVRMLDGKPGQPTSGPLAADGTFVFSALPAGEYVLGFVRGQREVLGAPRQVALQAGADVDLGVLPLAPAEDFVVEVLAADGGAVQQPRVFLALRERPRDFGPIPQQRSGAVCTVPGIPNGRFELLAWGEDVAPTFVPIEIGAGSRRLPVTAARGVPTRIDVRGVGREDWLLRLVPDGGEPFTLRSDDSKLTLGLRAGAYRAEVTCGGRSGSAEFAVGDRASAVEIVVPE